MERIFKGTIEITSGKIVCSDPCYDLGIWCAENQSAVNGIYNVYIILDKTTKRHKALEVIHKDYDTKNLSWDVSGCSCGVDSGTFGFFDYEYYEKYHEGDVENKDKNDKWYEDNICAIDGHEYNTDNKGYWSQAGYGDGYYPLDFAYLDDITEIVVGCRAIFIEDFEETEDEDTSTSWKNYKEDGDTSYNEFDELECDVDALESEVAQLIIKSQDYNVSEDKFEYLSVALENLQNFRKEMEKGRDNCREAYSK